MKIINNVVINHSNGANIEYLAGPFDENIKDAFLQSAFFGKIRIGNSYVIMAYGDVVSLDPELELVGVSILPDVKMVEGENIITVKDFLINVIGEDTYNLLPRMTEEEFYAIPE